MLANTSSTLFCLSGSIGLVTKSVSLDCAPLTLGLGFLLAAASAVATAASVVLVLLAEAAELLAGVAELMAGVEMEPPQHQFLSGGSQRHESAVYQRQLRPDAGLDIVVNVAGRC
ncbi:Hypothetical predicted protein [Xyrichtys novacula]|uniref:Uncharacterized protein n=1 Tax=Xyrichtys novacula TaxID=13765 RepID=A0AAV1FF57_XYRNO|nr:Hypothetical predicted protein [Xyrichtys novacula]